MKDFFISTGPSLPRYIAISLAIGAGFWGGLLFLVFGPTAFLPFPFGVGYVVLIGYIIRALSCPELGHRRLIWGLSILVQGGWFCLGLYDVLNHMLVQLWWTYATFGSVIALIAEEPDSEQMSGICG